MLGAELCRCEPLRHLLRLLGCGAEVRGSVAVRQALLMQFAGDYDVGCQNQVTYLSLLTDIGFSVGDITHGYSVPFHWFGGKIVERGIAGGISPLESTLA